jgi:hypothetical protein
MAFLLRRQSVVGGAVGFETHTEVDLAFNFFKGFEYRRDGMVRGENNAQTMLVIDSGWLKLVSDVPRGSGAREREVFHVIGVFFVFVNKGALLGNLRVRAKTSRE